MSDCAATETLTKQDRTRLGRGSRRRRFAPKFTMRPEALPEVLSGLDGRSAEAKFLRRRERELLSMLPDPNPAQRALAAQAAQLALRLALFDRKLLDGGTQTGHDTRVYLAWSNSYTRLLRTLSAGAPKGGAARAGDAWQRAQGRRGKAA